MLEVKYGLPPELKFLQEVRDLEPAVVDLHAIRSMRAIDIDTPSWT